MAATLLAGALFAHTASAQSTRDYISIVGSSTVYPFATVVAESFGKTTKFKTPKIESTGSGGGFKLFCTGVGVQTPDITNSSRRIKASEVEDCAANGVKDLVEVVIGYDGIVVANSKDAPAISLTRKDLYMALAKDVPDPAGAERLVANPYKTWKDVNPGLPALKIEVLGPPPTSGTRDAFVELAMEGGCKAFGWIAAIKKQDEKQFQAICHTVREDGAFIEAGENDNLIVQKLEANPKALGIFGFSFLDQNSDRIRGSQVDGIEPSFDSIADGSYPVSRPLYFYVKKAHVGNVPGIMEFLEEFTREDTWGDSGYLADRGLIPLPEEARSAARERVLGLEKLDLSKE
ncbi:MAG: PstS family phosphate ABC transporter substrate-binding protein [Gammaproteobacteria bacterium]|nr:PstS family phosphate ABC transporter substrate-binding protein [Gammaproteobacteria bacterium]